MIKFYKSFLKNGNRHGTWTYLAEACFCNPMISQKRAREKERSAKLISYTSSYEFIDIDYRKQKKQKQKKKR